MKYDGKALSWSIRDDVLEVALHLPPCNEIGIQSLEDLERLAALIRAGDHARALIIHSEQPGFCAGADLRELHRGMALRRAKNLPIDTEVRQFVERIHAVFDTIDTAPITTIAAVHGVCFGGGFELALTTDLIVADKSARFCFPELRLGLVPGFGGIPRLYRDVGGSVVRDLLFTGRSMGAKRAHAVGIVSQLVPRNEALATARRVAQQACTFDAETVSAAKAFAKSIPAEELRKERELFCRLITQPAVADALQKFVDSEDVRPYL